jgi:hypothetical protein
MSKKPLSTQKASQNITPVPSSDAIEPQEEEDQEDVTVRDKKSNGLPSPVTPADTVSVAKGKAMDDYTSYSSPSRKV